MSDDMGSVLRELREAFTRMLPVPNVPTVDHYLSTACLHGKHGECRLVCKYCKAPCRCNCHPREDAEE